MAQEDSVTCSLRQLRLDHEQQQALQRLSLEHDATVRRFQGERAMLLSLLATLLVGALTLWGLLLHPQLRHSEAAAKQAALAHAAVRSELHQQRTRFEAQIWDLESRNRELKSQQGLQLARPRSLVEPGQATKPRRSAKSAKPAPEQAACDAQDPLCGDLR